MNPDDALRKFFEEMKRQDAAAAPLFHNCLPRDTQPDRPRPVSRFLLFAMAASVLLVASALFFEVFHKNPALPEKHLEEWASLSNWQPSSDQLIADNSPLPAVGISAPTDTILEITP